MLTAANGEEALELARRLSPEVVLMDMMMPVRDGWWATEALKRDDRSCHVPVIAISASSLPQDRARSFEVGCEAFEPKPLNFKRLLEKIEHCRADSRCE